MKIKNRLKYILQELGIRQMQPTDDLLKLVLGGMTIHRFNQIINNNSVTELSMLEADLLKGWLSKVTNCDKSTIRLMVAEGEEVHA